MLSIPLLLTPALAFDTPLLGSKWQLRLDIGQEPGTWMPKRYPGWGESGGRMALQVDVDFTPFGHETADESSDEPVDGFLIDDKANVLRVLTPVTNFVSNKGTERVEFISGGWNLQRPNRSVRNARGTLVKPEAILRFWLDCPSGAIRNDIEIKRDTRIYFTTGVWDDPSGWEESDKEYRNVLSEMETLVEKTRNEREQGFGDNFFKTIMAVPRMVADAEEFDRLKRKKEKYEQELPPSGAKRSSSGVVIAPKGSLVIQGESKGWASEYLILGTFSAVPLSAETQ